MSSRCNPNLRTYKFIALLAVKPPSTCKLWPLINLAASLARNRVAFATSSGNSRTPFRSDMLRMMSLISGTVIPGRPSWKNWNTSGVGTTEEEMQFTRTPCRPSSADAVLTNPAMVPFSDRVRKWTSAAHDARDACRCEDDACLAGIIALAACFVPSKVCCTKL